MYIELMIQNGNDIFFPAVTEGLSWSTERRGSPGKLTFTVLHDEKLRIDEGNPVRLTVDGKPLFYGFIFTRSRDKQQHVQITAYDQLRYLTNKDTYVYTNKTASEVIEMIATDFRLNTGTIERTNFRIASRVEDKSSLFDIIYNALDLELTNNKKMFVFYDDFGRLTLKSLENMQVGLLIDEETGENYDYSTSIDDQTYNRIKLSFENKDTGTRDIYIAQDGQHINEWGVLQYFDSIKEGENGVAKANALLSLYNVKTRKLKIKNAFGDVRIRAGCMVAVKLNLGDVHIQNFMLVEKCTHNFNQSYHTMDLTLRGGEFVA